MQMQEVTHVLAPSGERRTRTLAAAVLRMASRGLEALAHRLARAEEAVVTEQVLEFYGDASAPEGALYINGQWVGTVMGVNRL